MIPPGIISQLDGLADLDFEGLPGIKPGELPQFGSIGKGTGYGSAINNALDSLDGFYDEFKAAAKQSSAALGGKIAESTIDLAGTIAGVTPLGPFASVAGPAMKKVIGWVTKIADNAQIRSQWVRCHEIEVDIVQRHLTGGVAFRRRLSIPQYTDCTPTHDPRRRLVVTPQRHDAPWLTVPPGLKSAYGSYPVPRGRVKSGFMVHCGAGSNAGEWNVERNKNRQSKKGLRRPTGYADFTALLYPWWCGNGPPRPAPAINKKSQAGNQYFSDPNIIMMAIQQQMLTDPLMNFFTPLAAVQGMRISLQVFGSGSKKIVNANETLYANDLQVGAALDLCSAFIDARVNFLQNEKALKVLANNINAPSMDPELKEAFFAKGSPKPKVPMRLSGLVKKTAAEKKGGAYLAAKNGEPIRLSPELMGSLQIKNDGTKNKSNAAPLLIAGAAAVAFMAMRK